MRRFSLLLGFALFIFTSLDATSQEFRIPFEVFARQAFETVRDKSGLKNLKYDMVGCDYALDAGGRLVPSIGVFTETERNEANSTGYALIHSDIIPMLSEGRLTFVQKTTIADFRIKTGGWAEWVNNFAAVASLGRVDVRTEDFVEAFARDAASKQLGAANERANDLLQKIRAGAFIESVEVTPSELVVRLGKPSSGAAKTAFSIGDAVRTGSGRIHPIQEWSPQGRSKDDAALVVTLFFDAMQLHSVASVNNGDPRKKGDGKLVECYDSDVKNPGENRIVLYLPDGFTAPDLSARFGSTKWHHWDDKIGSLIVRPGKVYSGQRLRLGEHPATHRDQGAVAEFGVGYHSLEASHGGKLFNRASQMRVVK